MLFQINCIDGSHYFYDNSLNRVYDRFYNLLDFGFTHNDYYNGVHDSGYSKKNEDFFSYHKEGIIREDNKVFNPKDIVRLEVTIGYKCNYRCKYCIQHNFHSDPKEPFDFEVFKRNFEASGIFSQLGSIKLTGGEPFVYWDRFKRFVEYFREELGFDKSLQVVTNGELFDREKYEFCLKHNIYVFFSHDAYAQTYYRHKTDYLENPETRELVIEQLKRGQTKFGYSKSGAISFMLTPKVYTPELGLDFFNEKLYEGVPVIPFVTIKCDSGTKFLLKDWTPQTKAKTIDSLVHAMLCDETDKYYNYYWRYRECVERIMYRLVNNLPTACQLGRCPNQISSKIIVSDYNGNLIACWGAPSDKSQVDGNLRNLSKAKFFFKTIKDFPNCWQCPYVVVCGGCTCPIVNNEDHAIRCESLMPLVKAEAQAAFTLLLGKRVKEFLPCDPLE